MTELSLVKQLTKVELKGLEEEQEFIRLYEMRTSINPRFTITQQANELDVSESTIKRMAKSEKFQQVVSKLAPTTRAPMVDAGRQFIQEELLPMSLEAAREILNDPSAAATARVSLMTSLWKIAFEGAEEASDDEQRRDAIDFLTKQGIATKNIQVIINNIQAPPEYIEALSAVLPDVIEGEATEV